MKLRKFIHGTKGNKSAREDNVEQKKDVKIYGRDEGLKKKRGRLKQKYRKREGKEHYILIYIQIFYKAPLNACWQCPDKWLCGAQIS